MIIRQANDKDSASIVEFQLAMAMETEQLQLHEPTVIKGVAAVLDDTSKGIYYVAETDGKVVGSLLTTFEWSDWRNGTVLWIQSVYVRPEFRKRSIFSRLYKHIQELVVSNSDLRGIRLYADKNNTSAHGVYEHLGMTAEHYQMYEWMKNEQS
ncbi:MAG: GNAT family N-acetyltransferase [Bacteroidota bacterium]|nr:GNAT family N-acetyltransferase [Bacteroidota bacterium]